MKRIYAITILLVAGLLALAACTESTTTPTPTDAVTSCRADFFAGPTECEGPTEVQFTDQSTGSIDGWLWDFGDGGNSTEQNPKHYYIRNGSYSVTLTITGLGCEDNETKIDYIQVSGC
jgi:PKD repeat protein